DVRRGAEHATLDFVTGEVLAGELPPRVVGAVQALLKGHREAALHAFNETLEHASPVTLRKVRRAPMTELEPLIDITSVRVLARYVVELTFADASARHRPRAHCSGDRCSSRLLPTTACSARSTWTEKHGRLPGPTALIYLRARSTPNRSQPFL